jgi:hypothetical protein
VNGTFYGKYIMETRKVTALAGFNFGVSSTFGSGNYYISCPTLIKTESIEQAVGLLGIYDSNAGLGYFGYARVTSPTNIYFMGNEVGPIGATVPITFAANDEFKMTVSYEKG